MSKLGNINPNSNQRTAVYDVNDDCPTLQASMGTGGNQMPMIIEEAKVVGGLGEMKSNKNTQFYQQDRVYSSDGMAMCLPSSLTGGSYNYLMDEAETITTKGEKIDVARTILNGYHRTNMTGWNVDNGVCERDSSHNYRIRKLTPKECFRLMGFTDEEFEKAQKVNSNTQLYKQAGNSIVVNVLEEIFKELILSLEGKSPKYKENEQMSLFDFDI